MFELLFSLTLSVIVHISTMALFGHLYGITITEISYGFGFKLITFKKVSVKSFPIGGYVKFADSRDEETQQLAPQQFFNHKPRYVRAAITLSGCLLMLLISILILGSQRAFEIFIQTYQQVFIGAIGPVTAGKDYIHQISSFIAANSLLTIYAATQLKVAALNLLPLPILNGGQALLTIIDKPEQKPSKALILAIQLSVFLYITLIICWLVALLSAYVYS